MMGQLSSGGLGDQAKSWVATDQPNQPITGEQLAQALGPEQISQVARNTGLSEDQAAHAMATALPEVVNAMTPQGEVPSDVQTPDRQTMESQINRLLGSVGQEQQAQAPSSSGPAR